MNGEKQRILNMTLFQAMLSQSRCSYLILHSILIWANLSVVVTNKPDY